MASFAESSATFTSRLQHTPVKSGRYLLLPNEVQPAFLIPLHSRKAFKAGLGLIKPITRKGEYKRNILGIMPRWLLRLKFKSMVIEGGNGDDRFSVILPWSQDSGSKFTMIHYDLRKAHVEVQKYAFSDETRDMVRNEYSYLQSLQVDGVSRIVIPEVRGFEDGDQYTVLTQPFYFGHYVQNIPSMILEFFAQLSTREIHALEAHPYMQQRYDEVMNFLTESGCDDLKRELDRLYAKYRETRFQVAIMHGDFSTTNTVQTPDNRYVLLDWEDAQERGLNLDVPFFEFRRQLYQDGEWSIQGAEGFLVVFHYVWFQVVKRNRTMLRDFRIEHGQFYSGLSRG